MLIPNWLRTLVQRSNWLRRIVSRSPVTDVPEPPNSGDGDSGGGGEITPPMGITYTTLAEHLFQTATDDGFYVDLGSIIIPAPGIGAAVYPTGFSEGGAPFKLEHVAAAGTPKWVRGTVTFWVTANWYGHSSTVNKVAFMSRKDTPNDQPSMYLNLRGSGTGALYADIAMQGTNESPDGARDLTQTSVQFVRNRLTTLVYELYIGTAGNDDGEARLWQDGVLLLDKRDCAWVPDGDAEYWTLPALYPIWGGGGGSPPTVPATQGMGFTRFKIETAP